MNSFQQKKDPLKNKYVKFLSVAGVLLLFSGCASPRILEDRGTIPPPSLAPSGIEEGSGESFIDVPILPDQKISVSEETIPHSVGELSDFPKIEAKEIQHKVVKGESFWTISKRYGVGMKELASYNHMDIKKPLNAGVLLTIPPGGKLITDATPVKRTATSSSSSGKTSNYTVMPGDSLWVISRKFGTTVDAITNANGISKNSVLKVGQKLFIPNKGTAQPVKTKAVSEKIAKPQPQNNKLTKEDADLLNDLINTPTTTETKAPSGEAQSVNFLPHTIKDGDTWNTISEMYGVSIDNLKKANPKVASENNLATGTVINVPEE